LLQASLAGDWEVPICTSGAYLPCFLAEVDKLFLAGMLARIYTGQQAEV